MDGTGGRDEDLSAAEVARTRRRERERTAKARELMRTGRAKAFKQILDAQARRAAESARAGGERGDAGKAMDATATDDDPGDRDPPGG